MRFLHVGTDVVIRAKELIAIINPKMLVCEEDRTREINQHFIQTSMDKNEYFDLSAEENESAKCVIVSDNRVYISSIRTATILARCKSKDDFLEGLK